MPALDIIINAIDNASGPISEVSDSASAATEQAGNTAASSAKKWTATGVAVTAVGVGLEAAARKAAPMNEETKKLSKSLGMTEEAMRDLVIETSDVTRPLDEVLGLMETARSQGIKSSEALKEYAIFWDTVGDATGESSEDLAKAGIGLKQLGVETGEEEKALGALGFITRETSGTVGEFLGMVGRLGPDLKEAGLGMDETTAILGIMEKELGMTGRVAKMEFSEALRSSDGDLDELFKTLGITTDQFEDYKKQVKASSGVIQENADIHAESYTPMQKLQHSAKELTYKYGDLLQVAGNIAPVFLLIGPAIALAGAAQTAYATVTAATFIPSIIAATTAAWTFTAAMLANPVTWIVVGIVALIAALVLLWKNWDQVTAFMGKAWEKIKEVAFGVWEAIIEFMATLPETIGFIIGKVARFILDILTKYNPAIFIIKNWKEILIFLLTLPNKIGNIMLDVISKIISFVASAGPKAKSGGKKIFDGIVNSIKGLPGKVWNVLLDVAGKVLNIGGTLWNNAKKMGENIWTGFKKGMGINSPSFLEKAMDAIEEKSTSMVSGVNSNFANIDGVEFKDASKTTKGTAGINTGIQTQGDKLDSIISLLSEMVTAQQVVNVELKANDLGEALRNGRVLPASFKMI